MMKYVEITRRCCCTQRFDTYHETVLTGVIILGSENCLLSCNHLFQLSSLLLDIVWLQRLACLADFFQRQMNWIRHSKYSNYNYLDT